MAAGGSSVTERTLEQTSTWAVAIVCAVFVLISVAIEHGILSLGKWFQKREKKAMIEALEKIKSELMLVGFISLLLAIGASYIPRVCVPEELGNKWLPCDKHIEEPDDKGKNTDRKLSETIIPRRALAAGGTEEYDYCTGKGKVSLISYTGVHQLHIFLFVLIVIHVFYSVVLVALGHAKMKKWKAWESETSTMEYQFTNDPARFRFAHQTSFVRRHSAFKYPGMKWVVAFFRQFFGSISKVDYITIRRGFINAHFASNTKFDFHKYVKRSMQDDYKSVLGISIPLWFFAIIFLFLNIYRWHTLAWISLVPLFIIVLVGTKLELVIMEMAQQIQDRMTVVTGAPIVEPSNSLFWFNKPQWILFLIHCTLFHNAYQMAYFLWKWYEFGITECFHEKLVAVLTRVLLGVALQILCSYNTFPLYSLVTQMGSNMKKSIFDEQTAQALKKWHQMAKQKKKKMRKADNGTDASIASPYQSGASTPTHGFSPVHLLHKYKTRGTQDVESLPPSPKAYASDVELSDLEASNHGAEETMMKPGEEQEKNVQLHHNEFSFKKSSEFT